MTLEERFRRGPAWSSLQLPPDGEVAIERRAGCIHFVGIGGIGMSGIAEVLLTLGYSITGSDLSDNDTTRRLRDLGAEISLGHDASNVGPETTVVVISSAVGDDNPEVQAAHVRRVPVIARAEMLAELMRVKCAVGVGGAHGKTTTTSLVATVLSAGGLDPTLVIGGRLKSLGGTNARLGRSRYMVVEADESDGSFLLLRPTVAVVTNIDREHMNHYGTMDALRAAYLEYINSIPFYGQAVLCLDCPEIAAMLPQVRKPHITYGTSIGADLRAENIEYDRLSSSFDVAVRGGPVLGRVVVAMPGEHAVRNALAALAVGMDFGIDFRRCADALASFEGIMRRFEIKGEARGVTVVDDYGHHPTEICATLKAARLGYPQSRIVAVFQPHRYSRLADLFELFAACFEDADTVIITDVYAAGEQAIEGFDGRSLAKAAARVHRDVDFEPAGADLAERIAARTRSGDLVLTLGAGDVTRLGPQLLQVLRSEQPASAPDGAAFAPQLLQALPQEG